jgi:hypothetical protein
MHLLFSSAKHGSSEILHSGAPPVGKNMTTYISSNIVFLDIFLSNLVEHVDKDIAEGRGMNVCYEEDINSNVFF